MGRKPIHDIAASKSKKGGLDLWLKWLRKQKALRSILTERGEASGGPTGT
jgi:hypothetical protein